ncbi:cholesterol 25-hydroxylase-like isoform X2 [Babylonia areolata]
MTITMPPQTTASQATTHTTSGVSTTPLYKGHHSDHHHHHHHHHHPSQSQPMAGVGTLTPVTQPDPRLLTLLRSGVVVGVLLGWLWADSLQAGIDLTWRYLRSAWWFRSVYFETVWATVSYAYLIPLYPFALHYLPRMDRYKVDTATTYLHQSVLGIAWEAVIYMAPLALLDTVMVKRYYGVDPQEWSQRQQHWVQTTRALPLHPPTLLQLCYQVIGGVLIYDALFFVLHLALHKHRGLYAWFHARHHQHHIMHAHITNQLSVGERIMLILAANQALKFLYSHPLSRAVFVPVFILLLIDNHTGYDLPWGLQHLLPEGMWGGPRLHHAHHMLGTRHYQPFLTYLDHALTWWEGRTTPRPKMN